MHIPTKEVIRDARRPDGSLIVYGHNMPGRLRDGEACDLP